MSDRRPYSSPLRSAEAAATRRRIVEAASRLFISDGYGRTTMRAIAEGAGVSLPTVHQHGPKSALLMAAYEVAIAGREGFSDLTDEAPMRSTRDARDIHDLTALLDSYSDAMTSALGRMAELSRVVRSAADTDPAVREVALTIEERRARSIRDGLQGIVASGILPATALPDVMTMVGLWVSADTYLFLRDAGWTPDRYRAWLRSQLAQLVPAA